MKHLFIILTLVFISTSTDAISCIDAEEPIEILNNFTLGAVQQAINDLAVNNTYDKCLVEIQFDYYTRNIVISFGPAFGSSELETNREVRVDLLIVLDSDKTIFNPAKIYNTVDFVCDYADECDRRFVLNHLEWLFNAKYDKLESAVRPLLTSDINSTGSCINYEDNKEQLCSDGMCYLEYVLFTNLIEGHCSNELISFSTQLILSSKIITDEDMYETEEQDQDIQPQLKIATLVSEIQYLCLPNNCNNQIIAESITNVVKEHYNISAMYEVLKVKIEEEHTTTSNGKSTTSHAPDVTSTEKTTLLTATSSTNIINSAASTITTRKQSNNTSTSLHISIILVILNTLLFFFD